MAYVRIGGHHMRLTAVIGRHGRRIVAWRLSDAMRACEAVACAEAAFAAHGAPSVMNSDQGGVSGSEGHAPLLGRERVTQGMDGRARRRDGVLMERWFRTLKSGRPRNVEHEAPARLESVIRRFVDDYSSARPRRPLGHGTPSSWHFSGIAEAA